MFDSISKNIKLQYFVLFIVAILAYSNTLTHSYTWDDALVIQQNEYTKAGIKGLKNIWTKKVFLHNRNVYRPVPQSIYTITYQIAPNKPNLAHFVNVLFYALAAMVTFWFLTLLFTKKNTWLIFFISLLFVLHPLHTEVVANIKSLDEILAYLFGLLSLSYWIIFLEKKNIKNFIFTILFFTLAILSKISAITFLAIFPLIFLFYFEDIKLIFKSLFAYLKNIFVAVSLSNKTISILSFILLILIYVFYKKGLNVLIIPAIISFAILLFKTQQKIIRLAIFSLITFILSGFNFEISLIVLPLLFSHYLLMDNKNKLSEIIIYLVIFVISFSIVNLELGKSIFILFLCSFPFLFKLKKEKIVLIFLAILIIITFIINMEFNRIIVILLSLIIYFTAYKKINYKLLFLILISISLVLDSYVYEKTSYFQQANVSNQIVSIENNQDVSVGMSILHNTLSEENNSEIKFTTIAKIQLKYLQLLFYPHPLVHQYGFNQITKTNFKDWKVWLSIIIHLGLLLFALYKLKTKSPISFGILFYLATISIYANIVILMPDTLAERFLFTPSLGFLIAFVFAINELLKFFKVKNTNLVITLIFIPILIAFAYKTIDRNKAWKNNLTLAENTIEYAPNNAAINAQYATELYLRNGDSTLIIKHYKRAIEIYPEFYSATKDLANYYIQLKQPKNAEKYFLKCKELKIDDWENFYFLAFINYEKKNYNQAISFFQKALIDDDKKVGKEKYIYSSEFLARCYFNNNQLFLADKLLKDNYKKYQIKSSIILLGNIYHQSRNTVKSLETYQILLNDFPNDQDLLKTIKILKDSLN
jgi:tetratricopeptide (TPR) repeat protein